MPQNFLACDRHQALLLPPDFREWLPDDHLGWFVIDVVAALDMAEFYASYRLDGHARAAHDPTMVLALLIYAYPSTGPCRYPSVTCSASRAGSGCGGLELATEEDETVQAGLRHIEFLDSEIAQVERLIAKEALASPQVKRLMTVPGVNVICAAIFLAAVGDIRRFKGSRQVVAYLGLDPRVYQSGSSPARGGRISKQGSPQARWALVEAARSVAQQPGPMHAFYERLRARKATTPSSSAVARKLAVLLYCMLTRDEDYAHQQPSLTAKKLRLLEVRAGAPHPQGHQHRRVGHPPADARRRTSARDPSHKRTVAGWQATSPNKKEAGASA